MLYWISCYSSVNSSYAEAESLEEIEVEINKKIYGLIKHTSIHVFSGHVSGTSNLLQTIDEKEICFRRKKAFERIDESIDIMENI